MTWKGVGKRADLIGGAIEILDDDGNRYYGPIKSIHVGQALIIFTTEWTAVLPHLSGDVHSSERKTFTLERKRYPPSAAEKGRVFFGWSYLGHGLLFPRGDRRLDPTEVRGLKVK